MSSARVIASMRAAVVLAAASGALACGSKTDLIVDRLDGSVLDQTLEDTCLIVPAQAGRAELDIVILVDASGSMVELAGGVPKFEALAGALETFFEDERSAGVGVSLSFFPFEDPDVPAFCASDDECGEVGACGANRCRQVPVLCETDRDCAFAGDTCEPVGRCGDTDTLCFLSDIVDVCDAAQPCRAANRCENRTSCDVEDYARAIVPRGVLPGAAEALTERIRTFEYAGFTPMFPGLSGAVLAAQRRRQEDPGTKVIVLLATDGFPTSCNPDPGPISLGRAVDRVAEVAADGLANGVETYVVGVFRRDRSGLATTNLSRIAQAGGQRGAVIVGAEFSPRSQLAEVFGDIRDDARGCAFSIPREARDALDPRELQVRLVTGGGDLVDELSAVDGPGGCGGTSGYFFEQDRLPGASPGFIELCPASCLVTADDPSLAVELEAGCAD